MQANKTEITPANVVFILGLEFAFRETGTENISNFPISLLAFFILQVRKIKNQNYILIINICGYQNQKQEQNFHWFAD